ncbi:hypothetical protein ACOMHN_010421 [Nucella lapillus]
MDKKTGETPSRFASNCILQAITHVRRRKARPDLAEICRQLKRLQNWTFQETKRCVGELLDLGIILRVEYKNNFSYRDPADLQKGHVSGTISSTEGLVEKLQSAIDGAITMNQIDHAGDAANASCSYGRGDDTPKGASQQQIEEWLNKEQMTINGTCMLRGNPLKEVLESEVIRATVIRRRVDGMFRYTVGNRVTVIRVEPRINSVPQSTCVSEPTESEQMQEFQGEEVPAQVQATEPSASASASDINRQRPPSKRKRTLKYKEEIYELPPVKKNRKQPQTSPTQNTGTAVVVPPKQSDGKSVEEAHIAPKFRLAAMFRLCNEVHQMESPSRHAGQESEMLKCYGCNMTAHPDCLSYSAPLLTKIDRATWRCVTCKKCACCGILLRTPAPLTCSGCDLAYHKNCHKPSVRKMKNREGWLCMKCMGTETLLVERASAAATEVKTPTATPAPSATSCDGAKNEALVEESSEEEEEEEEGEGQEEEEEGEDSQHSIPAAPAVKSGASASAATTAAGKDTAFPPTPRDSPSIEDACLEQYGFRLRQQDVLPHTQRVQKISHFDGTRFPDPTKWTGDELYDFITTLPDPSGVFLEAAEALRKQGIDGETLMYLSRNDILTRFDLKIGPALKLHRLIVNMRTDGNAHKYVPCEKD